MFCLFFSFFIHFHSYPPTVVDSTWFCSSTARDPTLSSSRHWLLEGQRVILGSRFEAHIFLLLFIQPLRYLKLCTCFNLLLLRVSISIGSLWFNAMNSVFLACPWNPNLAASPPNRESGPCLCAISFARLSCVRYHRRRADLLLWCQIVCGFFLAIFGIYLMEGSIMDIHLKIRK